ncbi:MAG: 2-C-methyl-D-erythritol 4-phosphate cytidylyltransferase [Deltaproteobacteria bacterium]|jgi:2-C-methyl-D-erythritol 4-phosphate cytidylyltransferase|nr:2-C-methyl-D-erythritol 4-phosphate cytidylyltransferase [Deltaproteobacteria bacterium]
MASNLAETENVSAIIVAAGQGRRMEGDRRKQYLSLAGLPILTRTLMAFHRCGAVDEIILVVPEDDIDFCRETILKPEGLSRNITLSPGGERRQDSVFNGLKEVNPNCRIVVIHDGVRPFVQTDQITACIDGARQCGACILGVPAYETLKQVDPSDHIIRTLKRDDVWLAQTPQAFGHDLIRKAHDRARIENYTATDDASLVEKLGATVKIVQGSRRNIKITVKEDLEMARWVLSEE